MTARSNAKARWNFAAAVAVLASVAVAASQRFVLDDAFISFRYARHIAEGDGFVWNVGEPPIEGFTNFLWTMVIAVAARAGIDPESSAHVIGLACFGGTLVSVHGLAFELTRSRAATFATTALAGLNPTLSAFATSGLETSAQTFLCTATLFVLARCVSTAWWPPSRVALLGLLPALAVAVRLDATILAFVSVGTSALGLARDAARTRRTIAVMIASAAAVLVPLVAVKLSVFHGIVPNTYAAKIAGDGADWARGASFVLAFGLLQGAIPLAALVIASWMRTRSAVATPLIAFVVAWTLYVTFVGGDFMDFRFMVPVLPCGLALGAWAIDREVKAATARAAIAMSIGILFLVGWRLSRGDDYFHPALQVETVRALSGHIDRPTEDWRGIGRRLGEAFTPKGGVTLAVTAAGAIPYHSRLRTVDMYGLNDAWIARNGALRRAEASGHRRIAQLGYLLDRRVNLLVPAAAIALRGDPRRTYAPGEVRRQFFDGRDEPLPASAKVIEVPLDDRRAFRALYLTPHPEVDALLQAPGCRSFAIAAPAPRL